MAVATEDVRVKVAAPTPQTAKSLGTAERKRLIKELAAAQQEHAQAEAENAAELAETERLLESHEYSRLQKRAAELRIRKFDLATQPAGFATRQRLWHDWTTALEEKKIALSNTLAREADRLRATWRDDDLLNGRLRGRLDSIREAQKMLDDEHLRLSENPSDVLERVAKIALGGTTDES